MPCRDTLGRPMAPPKAPGTGGLELPPREPLHERLVAQERARMRHPSQAEIEAVVEEAVEEERLHNRVNRCEERLDNLEEHRKLSVTAKATIAAAIIGAVGTVAVVVIQGMTKIHDDVAADAVKQSKDAAARVVTSSQPSTSDTYAAGAASGAAKALADFQKQLEEKDLVIVPRSVVRAKPKH